MKAGHFLISVEDQNNPHLKNLTECIVVNSIDGTGLLPETYGLEYGLVSTESDAAGTQVALGTVGFGYSGSQFNVYYTPDANRAVEVRVLGQAVENTIFRSFYSRYWNNHKHGSVPFWRGNLHWNSRCC